MTRHGFLSRLICFSAILLTLIGILSSGRIHWQNSHSATISRPFKWMTPSFFATAAPTSIPHPLNPYPHLPLLTFTPTFSSSSSSESSSLTFKLTIFSDLHYGENPWDDWGPEQDVNSTRLMRRVLSEERPDYVVLNGDLITGENTFRENATSLIDEIVAPLNEARIPFSSTHGNHDNQANITHLAEIERELQVARLSYTRPAPSGVGGTASEGPGNYWVPVYARATDRTPALILWFFDSRGGFAFAPQLPHSRDVSTPAVPDWVDGSVAAWIEREVEVMDGAWGGADEGGWEGRGRGSVVFVHIPPHAIQAVQAGINGTLGEQGLNEDLLGSGSTQATTDTASVGNDQPFWDAVNNHIKNLHVVISGHDHGNEWCAREPSKDVIFCFDKHSGYGGYSGTDWGHGVRNLVFNSPDPRDGVETWIRLEGGDTRARVKLDEAFGR